MGGKHIPFVLKELAGVTELLAQVVSTGTMVVTLGRLTKKL